MYSISYGRKWNVNQASRHQLIAMWRYYAHKVMTEERRCAGKLWKPGSRGAHAHQKNVIRLMPYIVQPLSEKRPSISAIDQSVCRGAKSPYHRYRRYSENMPCEYSSSCSKIRREIYGEADIILVCNQWNSTDKARYARATYEAGNGIWCAAIMLWAWRCCGDREGIIEKRCGENARQIRSERHQEQRRGGEKLGHRYAAESRESWSTEALYKWKYQAK